MEPFTAIKPEDLEVIKQHERISQNFKRLLSQIFTLVAIDYKILVGRAQNYGDFTGWHFKFKDYPCWFGVCFKSGNFLGTRFQIKVDDVKPAFKEALLKIKGFEEAIWEKAPWMGREQPTQALQAGNRDEQVRVFSGIVNDHLGVITAVEAQMGTPEGDIPLKPM